MTPEALVGVGGLALQFACLLGGVMRGWVEARRRVTGRPLDTGGLRRLKAGEAALTVVGQTAAVVWLARQAGDARLAVVAGAFAVACAMDLALASLLRMRISRQERLRDLAINAAAALTGLLIA